MRHLLFALILAFLPLAAKAEQLPDPVEFSVTLELGRLDKARAWLDAGLSPDFEGKMIGTGLMIGAWEGNIPLMELFLSRGADINKVNALGEQAILLAAWKGRIEAVRWLVERGAKINREGKQWAALHYSTFAGHEAIVSFLLERGADVNALSTNGSTPLMMAAREGRESIADRLLASGANGNIANESGDTAVTWAMRNNNLTIAKTIAGMKFPEIASRPAASFGPPVRSVPVPDRVDSMLAQARKLELAGKREEALKTYRAALALVKQVDSSKGKTGKAAEPAKAVSGLTITAKRGKPTQQTAGLQYQTPALHVADAGATGAAGAKVGAGGTAPAGLDAQGAAEYWLQQARGHEAAGRTREAVAAYRQASAALRGR